MKQFIYTHDSLAVTEKLGELGCEIYERRYKDKFEKAYPGKYVAIEFASGDAFIGNTQEEATEAALSVYPGEIFFFTQVPPRHQNHHPIPHETGTERLRQLTHGHHQSNLAREGLAKNTSQDHRDHRAPC